MFLASGSQSTEADTCIQQVVKGWSASSFIRPFPWWKTKMSQSHSLCGGDSFAVQCSGDS